MMYTTFHQIAVDLRASWKLISYTYALGEFGSKHAIERLRDGAKVRQEMEMGRGELGIGETGEQYRERWLKEHPDLDPEKVVTEALKVEYLTRDAASIPLAHARLSYYLQCAIDLAASLDPARYAAMKVEGKIALPAKVSALLHLSPSPDGSVRKLSDDLMLDLRDIHRRRDALAHEVEPGTYSFGLDGDLSTLLESGLQSLKIAGESRGEKWKEIPNSWMDDTPWYFVYPK